MAGAAILTLTAAPAIGAAAKGPEDAKTRTTNDFDIRKTRQHGLAAQRVADTGRIRAELGQQALVDVDELTGTPRVLGRTDGFLTGPSSLPAQEIALRYLREHENAVGLTAADQGNLKLRKDYVDAAGTHHLSFVQQAGGVPLFGNGLKAHVAKDGRLIQLDGSPVRGLPQRLGVAAKAAPAKDSKQVAFFDGDTVRLAWSTIARPKLDEMYLEVVDARDGTLLFRKNLVQKHSDDTTGLAWGAKPGKQQEVDLAARGWLPAGAKVLDGNVAHVGSDYNGDYKIQPEEEVGRNADGTFRYRFKDFTTKVGSPCSAAYRCTWDPKTDGSWKVNREQNAVQVLSYIGTFHDHLASFPIGFTSSAGNFEKTDGDAVEAHTLLGVGKDKVPYNNAFMATPPDGQPPNMGMFLTHNPDDPNDTLIAGNMGDVAEVVFHEYVHGLSNRLVVDSSGLSTLDAEQSYAMGEAWGDWYAFDYLAEKKLVKDTAEPGEIVNGGALSAGQNNFRSEPTDCPVGTTSPKCPGSPGAGPGGYTYGDYGRVIDFAEVHADGEIWAQTLWDLRTALGVPLTRSLVTRAMELTPASPSFLDMRNSILQADSVVNGGQAHTKIWQVFAKRGMGFFAGSVTGADVRPAEDFSTPPPTGTPTGSVSGRVVDSETGLPVTGAAVRIAGHDSGFFGDKWAATDEDGRYTIENVVPGTYPKMYAFIPGMDGQQRAVSVRSGKNTVDWALRRDWATSTTGAEVTAFNGADYSQYGCGPSDLLRRTPTGSGGWSTDATKAAGGGLEPRSITIKLGQAVDVSAVEIDPSGTCGDDSSAAAKDVTVETSVDGTTWVAAGKASYTTKELGALHPIALASGSTAKVRFLRLTILANQVSLHPEIDCAPGKSAAGCFYSDVAGLAVRGTVG
ncbi:hypothetical protein Lesp02_31810 [Lentzea sp. NBRC 105346]|nr:hypothetical protein Lesp02_31810 [Lentzea sp. NBRC 105346]